MSTINEIIAAVVVSSLSVAVVVVVVQPLALQGLVEASGGLQTVQSSSPARLGIIQARLVVVPGLLEEQSIRRLVVLALQLLLLLARLELL